MHFRPFLSVALVISRASYVFAFFASSKHETSGYQQDQQAPTGEFRTEFTHHILIPLKKLIRDHSGSLNAALADYQSRFDSLSALLNHPIVSHQRSQLTVQLWVEASLMIVTPTLHLEWKRSAD